MPVWTITGEAAKAWDTTSKTLAERAVENASLTFRSVGVDELVLNISPQNVVSYTIPTYAQRVDLFRNGSRFFTGYVTNVRTTSNNSITVTVSNAWWFMERINYVTSQTDGAGASANRLTGVFGNATSGTNLTTAIQTAIDTSVSLGVPMANITGGSTVGSYFDIPRVTLNQSTCAQVISELVRLVPDTMTYFDYTNSTPTFNVVRRAAATTRTLTIGTSPVEDFDVNPMIELQVSQVVLPYVTRDTNGLTSYQTQSSGTATVGKIQVLTISGPELDTFLPSEYFDSATLTGFPLATQFEDFVLSSSQFAGAVANGLRFTRINIQQGQRQYSGYNSGKGTTTGSFNPNVRSVQYTQPAVSVTDDTGQPASLGTNLILSDNLPEWAITAHNLKPIVISGQWIYEWKDQVFDFGDGYEQNEQLPPWLASLTTAQKDSFWDGDFHYILIGGEYTVQGYTTSSSTLPHMYGTTLAGTNSSYLYLASTASSIDGFYTGMRIAYMQKPGSGGPDGVNDVWYIATIGGYNGTTKAASISGATGPATRSGFPYRILGTKVFAPADYSFISPPANLASNLLSTMNFIPYEGTVRITEQTAGGTRYRGCKVNLANTRSELASMGAMVAEETLDLKNGTTDLTLGTPPRLDYRSFTDKIRRTSQDNIVFNP
jgi:hypothetical protein